MTKTALLLLPTTTKDYPKIQAWITRMSKIILNELEMSLGLSVIMPLENMENIHSVHITTSAYSELDSLILTLSQENGLEVKKYSATYILEISTALQRAIQQDTLLRNSQTAMPKDCMEELQNLEKARSTPDWGLLWQRSLPLQ